jgi:Mg2+-importing ATPase
MIAIATDTVDKKELDRPKSYQMHTVIFLATLFGAVSSVFDFMLFGYFYRISPEALQTAWFMLSVATEVVLIFSLRTSFVFFKAKRPSFSLAFFSLSALLIAAVLPFTPFGAVLHFVRLDASSLVFVGLLAAGYFLVTELVKRMYERHLRQSRREPAIATT